MHQHKKIKVIISGGGTGGHIFPAIAIANALKNKVEDCEILFIGAKGRMEMEKVPAAGYQIEGLWISGFQRNLSAKNLSFPFKVIVSLMKAKKIIKYFNPDVVIGVGGYASGPTLKVATRKGIPTLIQEQNSFPGITNRLLAKSANKICVAYDGMDKYFPFSKIILTGNPVRQEVIDLKGKKDKAFEYFNLLPANKVLLVIGGSQGAKSINEAIHKNLDLIIKNNIRLIWQTGKYYFSTANEIITTDSSYEKNIRVVEFISRMDYAYAIADVVISRAGAIAIAELCAVKKPSVLVPLPTAAEDHQTKNAMALVNKNAALLVKDNEANEKLAKTAIDLINNEDKKTQFIENMGRFEVKNSAEIIADEIIDLSV